MVRSKDSYWLELIKQYESSGLSQEEFCRKRLIPLTKFKYRWRRQMEIENVRPLDRSIPQSSLNQFEEVSILEGNTSSVPENKTRGLSILFPNQIRCELNISVSRPEFGMLLKQLVSLC
jgi:hypothetical protein